MRYAIILCLLFAGCQSAPVLTKPQVIKVEVEKLIPIPREYFTACTKPAPIAQAVTNGDLELIAYAYELNYAPCLQSRLDDIKRLQYGESKD